MTSSDSFFFSEIINAKPHLLSKIIIKTIRMSPVALRIISSLKIQSLESFITYCLLHRNVQNLHVLTRVRLQTRKYGQQFREWEMINFFKVIAFKGTNPGRFLKGFDLIILPYLLYVFGQTGLNKQCRSRSDAAKRGVWSRSTLFATHPAILRTFTGSKMDLLRRSIR